MIVRLLTIGWLLAGVVFAGPVVRRDVVTINPRGVVRVPVLKNDTPGLAPGSIRIASQPKFGTVAVNPDGTIVYRNTKGNPAFDTFRYRINGRPLEAAVGIRFSRSLRLPPVPTNVPLTPPNGDFSLPDAFSAAFNQPVALATPPGDDRRLFVVEKGGLIRLISDVTNANAVPVTFLDLAKVLRDRGELLLSDGEQGFLGLAFHPQYANNGYFYVFYCATKNGTSTNRVARFEVSANNSAKADPASELILLSQIDEASNHNGGCLQFGADGYLYISLGDEGGGNDSYNNSQRIDKDFFSGILRIDVDKKSGSVAPNPHSSIPLDNGVARFAIPADNPFLGRTSFNGASFAANKLRFEFWAVGLRNPWRFSFDSATGDLWCGDVGQNAWEEIDLVTAGGNYGWAYREGNHPGPKTPPAGFTSISPVVDYGHGSGPFQGDSVTGGVVYRGDRFADLSGAYVYADFSTGNVWALNRTPSGPSVRRLLAQSGLAAFGIDPSNRDILACNLYQGKIKRLIQSPPNDSRLPKNLTATGIFANLKFLKPNPGFVAYTPNVPFWSDYAIKRRWFSIPDGSTIEWNLDGSWIAPTGTIWVKHFDLESVRGNPATARRVETRILVRNDTGVYGLTYLWNAAQTEAFLVGEAGADVNIPVTVNGITQNQVWHYPSRAECNTCHNGPAGYSLSFNTRQINRDSGLNQFAGNQIELLKTYGYFSGPVPAAVDLPKHSSLEDDQLNLEDRVRSYLAVNCAYCHQDGGTAAATWDARPELTLNETGLINGALLDNGGDLANRLVVPGDLTHSGILQRIQGTGGFSRMPPLATNQIDPKAVQLVTDWIQNYLPSHP